MSLGRQLIWCHPIILPKNDDLFSQRPWRVSPGAVRPPLVTPLFIKINVRCYYRSKKPYMWQWNADAEIWQRDVQSLPCNTFLHWKFYLIGEHVSGSLCAAGDWQRPADIGQPRGFITSLICLSSRPDRQSSNHNRWFQVRCDHRDFALPEDKTF